MIFHDQHVHSIYSEDSNEIYENYVKKAIEVGCSYFVTTEHLDINLRNSGKDWLVDYDALKENICLLQQKYPKIKILLGIECGYKRDYLDIINDYLNSQNFDLVNLSIHDYKNIDFYYKDEYLKHGVDTLLKLYFDLCIDGIQEMDEKFDVFCHFDYAYKCALKADPNADIKKYENQLIQIFKLLIEKDKTLELNTKVQESINNDEYIRYWLTLYKKLGGKNLSLSSDAHTLNRYRSSFERMIPIIKECGFDKLTYYVKRVKRYVEI